MARPRLERLALGLHAEPLGDRSGAGHQHPGERIPWKLVCMLASRVGAGSLRRRVTESLLVDGKILGWLRLVPKRDTVHPARYHPLTAVAA